jgi:hypothetical protein
MVIQTSYISKSGLKASVELHTRKEASENLDILVLCLGMPIAEIVSAGVTRS